MTLIQKVDHLFFNEVDLETFSFTTPDFTLVRLNSRLADEYANPLAKAFRRRVEDWLADLETRTLFSGYGRNGVYLSRGSGTGLVHTMATERLNEES